jgi:electron transfer flavoprotein alpha subunit
MSVIIYIENTDGTIKKGTLEAVSYGVNLATNNGVDAIGVSIGKVSDDEIKKVGNYGLSKVINVAMDDTSISHLSVSATLKSFADSKGADSIVMSNSWMGKSTSPRLAIEAGFGVVTEVVELPANKTVKKKGFSGKAFVIVNLENDKNIFAIAPNSYGLKENKVEVSIESGSASSNESIKHVSYNKDTNKISLTDAELVVSAGRGLKGPENWGMIEELADVLGAGTACSKPVSDADWRPHHEHVGQTGITISPNLYIAVGISGAIQHLAGVSSSKKIVVINTDPEAPFFKAADYGIVGDAFDVIPKLTEAIRKIKN